MAMSRSRGAMSFTTSPLIAISPPVTVSSPAIMRSVVDFPHPEGPTNTTNSRSATSKSMPCTTCICPYFLMSFLTETCAITLSPYPA
jgi:hypothetical protein